MLCARSLLYMTDSNKLRYDTLLFDADGTVLDFKRSEKEALTDCLKKFGLPYSDDVVEVYSRINDDYWKKLERREIDKNRLRVARFESFCEHFGFDCDVSSLAVAYTDTLATKSYITEGADTVCRRLHSAGCRLYIITNGLKTVQNGRFNGCVLHDMFEHSFISEEIGTEKPDVRYFEAVAAAIPDFDKRRTLVIGDSLTSDIRGGIDFGLDVCWFNPFGKTAPETIVNKITYTVNKITDVADIVLEN